MIKKVSTLYLTLALMFLAWDLGLVVCRILTSQEKGVFFAFLFCMAIYVTVERFFNKKAGDA